MAANDADDARCMEALAALVPTETELALLIGVTDDKLQGQLLFNLLRAPEDEPVRVLVSARMKESDAFVGASLPDLLACEFLDATLQRAVRQGVTTFSLRCPSSQTLNTRYEGGDDILDKLIEYFVKGLIRFPTPQACDARPQSPLALAAICAPHVCTLSIRRLNTWTLTTQTSLGPSRIFRAVTEWRVQSRVTVRSYTHQLWCMRMRVRGWTRRPTVTTARTGRLQALQV